MLAGCAASGQRGTASSTAPDLTATGPSRTDKFGLSTETPHVDSGQPPVFDVRQGKGHPTAKKPGTHDISAGITRKASTPDAVLDEALDFCELSQTFWQKGELENALEALDQAYALILEVNTEENPDITQQKEDLRFLISKRILEIYASRNIVVNGHHNAIPLDINSHVQQEIDSFTRGREKKQFMAAYRRSGRYRRFIVEALREAGIPEELSWLPLIESGYKVKALSKARALGLWQFIPSTGYKFGLKRSRYVDERLDPYKSTRAAIEYLKELHQIFGDWITVLAAYNCGEGRVLRVIRNQQVNYLDNFWDLYRRLPRETARYVPRFLATLHIVNNPEKYGLDKIRPDPPVEFDTLTVTRRVSLSRIATVAGVSAGVLKSLNPELRRGVLPPERYELKVPPGKSDGLLAKIEHLPQATTPSTGGTYVVHRVRRGETISTIARRYNTSVHRIARANNLNSRYLIVAGQRLKIPRRGTSAPVTTAARKPKKNRGKITRHVVRRGDSLWIIARRYSTTTRHIQQVNGLKSSRLHIGQVLIIRTGEQGRATAHTGGTRQYRVRSGDSPFRIATIHNMSVQRLLHINHLSPRSKIYPGQTLLVD
jgi:membrane-bound lytic murein transglycosylase D